MAKIEVKGTSITVVSGSVDKSVQPFERKKP